MMARHDLCPLIFLIKNNTLTSEKGGETMRRNNENLYWRFFFFSLLHTGSSPPLVSHTSNAINVNTPSPIIDARHRSIACNETWWQSATTQKAERDCTNFARYSGINTRGRKQSVSSPPQSHGWEWIVRDTRFPRRPMMVKWVGFHRTFLFSLRRIFFLALWVFFFFFAFCHFSSFFIAVFLCWWAMLLLPRCCCFVLSYFAALLERTNRPLCGYNWGTTNEKRAREEESNQSRLCLTFYEAAKSVELRISARFFFSLLFAVERLQRARMSLWASYVDVAAHD